MFRGRAERPASTNPWIKFAFYNIGWNPASRKAWHTKENLAIEIDSMVRDKVVDAVGICEVFNLTAHPGSTHNWPTDTAYSSAVGVEQSSISQCSAEQPALSPLFKMSSIRDVQAWLNGERVASCSSAQAQRIREAVALLS